MFYFKTPLFLIRQIKDKDHEVFLTFDDGPHFEMTPAVLDILMAEGAKATFFVIGQKAEAYPELIKRMQQEGHTVYSHSLDHNYNYYFRGQGVIQTWLKASLVHLQKILLQTTAYESNGEIAFRPPAGVLTPPLMKGARELQIPIVLWTHRFYDSVFQWTEKKAMANIKNLKGGDIILLHDCQKKVNQKIFLTTLQKYLQEIHKKGYRCSELKFNLLQNEVEHVYK